MVLDMLTIIVVLNLVMGKIKETMSWNFLLRLVSDGWDIKIVWKMRTKKIYGTVLQMCNEILRKVLNSNIFENLYVGPLCTGFLISSSYSSANFKMKDLEVFLYKKSFVIFYYFFHPTERRTCWMAIFCGNWVIESCQSRTHSIGPQKS